MSVRRFALLSSVVPAASNFVATPGGLWPADCVHEVPTGTRIREHATGVEYTFPNGTEVHHGNCTAEMRGHLRSTAFDSKHQGLPLEHHHHHHHDHAYPVQVKGELDGELEGFAARYIVPPAPAVQDGQTIYWSFRAEDGKKVLQPVLGWYSGDWHIASWSSASGHMQKGAEYTVSEGDTVGALIFRDAEKDGYNIVTEANGQKSVLYADDHGKKFNDIVLGMETYDISHKECEKLPQSCFYVLGMDATPRIGLMKKRWEFDSHGFDLSESCDWSRGYSNTDMSTCPNPTVV